jgi:hypothetical protein
MTKCTEGITTLQEAAEQLIAESKRYESAMSLFVSEEGQFVRLLLDTSRHCYNDSGYGIVGGDCGLLRDMETNEVIGIKLRVINNKLMVGHDGPLRVNQGFLKEECKDGQDGPRTAD